jgi:hypothetical protein
MRVKQNKHKPIIFGNCREVLATVIVFYFTANLVFGAEEETEFCGRRWSEFVNDRKKWETECLNEDSVRASLCCTATAGYLEHRYEDYIKWCPIVGKFFDVQNSSKYGIMMLSCSTMSFSFAVILLTHLNTTAKNGVTRGVAKGVWDPGGP